MITLNGIEINTTIFPDKTSQVWQLDEQSFSDKDVWDITWLFESEEEFLHLAQLVYLCKCEHSSRLLELHLPYLPYARQDKRPDNELSFALYPFMNLLNGLEFNRVTVVDAHSSEKISWGIDNCINILPKKEISYALKSSSSTVVAFPDSGAYQRYKSCVPKDTPYVEGIKDRNQLTGEIINYEIVGDGAIIENETVLIVDDICDGGMTFRLLAETLLDRGAEQVNLYVSHGLFTKGLGVLRSSGIDRIFTYYGEVGNPDEIQRV